MNRQLQTVALVLYADVTLDPGSEGTLVSDDKIFLRLMTMTVLALCFLREAKLLMNFHSSNLQKDMYSHKRRL